MFFYHVWIRDRIELHPENDPLTGPIGALYSAAVLDQEAIKEMENDLLAVIAAQEEKTPSSSSTKAFKMKLKCTKKFQENFL